MIKNKILTIKKNKDFRRLYRSGRFFVSEDLVTYALRRKYVKITRLGITTSRKVGCAVKRNRARRVIKESYRRIFPRVYPGYDIVFVARGRTTSVSCNNVFFSMNKHLLKLGCVGKYETLSNISN
ncbi:MAG: ribonuclease P protein component [Oscillospiraceae bacterium]|nr:ribonuclease P protein component [Oscillospiraceae bacterium]